MQTNDTFEIVRRFNQAFEDHNPALLDDLVAPEPDASRRRQDRRSAGLRKVTGSLRALA